MQRWFSDSGAVLVLAVLLSHSNNIASGFLSPFVATKGRPISVSTGVRAPLHSSRLFMGRKIEEEEETLSTAKVAKKNKKKASGKKNVTQSKKEAAKPTAALSEQEADAAAAGVSISATTASTKTTTTTTNANVNTDPVLNSGNSINIDSVLFNNPSVSATPPETTTETEEEGSATEAPAIAARKVFPSATDGFVDASASTRSSSGSSSTAKKTKTNNKSDSNNNSNRGGRDDVIDTDLVNMRVPRNDPLRQSIVPPEVVFFGEPRNPPPPEAVGDLRYHGSLLYWARHATVAPRTSEERLSCVFPKGRLHPESPKYRLIKTTTAASTTTTSSSSSSIQEQQLELTYEKVFAAFEGVMEDLEASKAFVDSNIDLVPPKLFLRVLTTEKLAAQAKNDLERMDHLKDVRRKYILASDQVFFPLNIEVQKAETRVMSYLARDELRNFASIWDEVESTLHFAVLLAARLTWDGRVKEVLDDIKKKIENTVGYMADGIRKDLMSREFRKPGITAEVYLNASMTIQERMPELYAKVAPEVQFLHETYFMTQKENAGELLTSYLTTEFCPKRNISPDQIKERLKILDATVAAIQGTDYVRLRLLIQEVFQLISTKEERLAADHWYFERQNRKGYGFDTYEPDEIPQLIQYEQRIRETGNAFQDFAVGVLKAPTSYTDAFSGSRKKGSQVENWLKRDPDWNTPDPDSYEARMAEFQQAYAVQTQLRKEAEGKLNRMVRDRMDRQDRVLMGASNDDVEDNDASALAGMFESEGGGGGGGARVIDLTDSEMEEAE